MVTSVDKYEFKLKVDEMKALVSARNYNAAAEIAETINWRKIRNLNALVLAGEVFEQVERYEESKEILLMAYDKSPIGRNIIYRLAEIAIKTRNFEEAQEYYDEFVDIAPHDNLKFVLKYKMTAAQGLPYEDQIKILEELKEQEYSEEWAYELAYLYHRDKQPEKCVEACDELILWFGDGIYVEKALELKMLYQPLTKSQEEKYRLFRQKRTGVIEVKPNDFLESGEIVNEAVEIPSVETNAGRYNTANLQQEIAKGMQQIAEAAGKDELSDGMNSIQRAVEEMPYQSMDKFTQDLHSILHGGSGRNNYQQSKKYNGQRRFMQQGLYGQQNQSRMSQEWNHQEQYMPQMPQGQGQQRQLTSQEQTQQRQSILQGQDWQRRQTVQEQGRYVSQLQGQDRYISQMPQGQGQQSPYMSQMTQDRFGQPEDQQPVQLVNQMSIEEILAEWEKTKQATQEALQETEEHSLDEVKERVLLDAEKLMDRLMNMIPQLAQKADSQEGSDLRSQSESQSEEVEIGIEEAGRIVAGMNKLLQEQIDSLTAEQSQEQTEGLQEQKQQEQAPASHRVSDPTRKMPKLSDYVMEKEAASAERKINNESLKDFNNMEISKNEPEAVQKSDISDRKKPEAVRTFETERQEMMNAVQKERMENRMNEYSQENDSNKDVGQRYVSENGIREYISENIGQEYTAGNAVQENLSENAQKYVTENELQKYLSENIGQEYEEAKINTAQRSAVEEAVINTVQRSAVEEAKMNMAQRSAVGKDEMNAVQRSSVEDVDINTVQRSLAEETGINMKRSSVEDAGINTMQRSSAEETGINTMQGSSVNEAGINAVQRSSADKEEMNTEQRSVSEGRDSDLSRKYPPYSESMAEEEYPARNPDVDLRREHPSDYTDMDKEADFSSRTSQPHPSLASRPHFRTQAQIQAEEASKTMNREEVEEFSEEDMEAAAQAAGFYQNAPLADVPQGDKEKHLTPEQKQIFSYFVLISGMESQIFDLIKGVSDHLLFDKNSLSGNIIVEGIQGSGKTVLIKNIIMCLQKQVKRPNGKIGKIDANVLNQKDLAILTEKVSGGCLIIESAGKITRDTAVKLSQCMENDHSGTLYILEDTKQGIQKALERDSSFAAKFTEKISIPLFKSDELVAFGRAYANDLDYDIDEMGVLALYKRINSIQTLEHVTTLTEVKEIVDEAIENAEKGVLKKVFSILTSSRSNEENYVILREKDFE